MRSVLLMAAIFAAPVMAADEVKIETLNFEQLEKAIQAHKGKVVVVDVWGTF